MESKPSQPFYIQRLDELLDTVITSVNPSDDLPRIVRSIVMYGRQWKSNEHKSFLLFYSAAALKDILPPIYYHHWLLLVNAFLILLRKRVTEKDLETVDLLLCKFVVLTKKHYGLKAVTFNVHLLTHVVSYVRSWGLPWCYSAFLYEGVGGLLKKLFH